MSRTDDRTATRRKRKAVYLTEKEANAAMAAIDAMLAGEEKAGDWPENVEANDLERAAQKIFEAQP